MKLRILLILTSVFSLSMCFADDEVTTIFDNPDWIESDYHEKAALYKVQLQTRYTLVTIRLQPTKNKDRQNYWTSKNTYIIAGNAKLPLLGAEGKDGTYHDCTYNDHWGWNNVKKRKDYYYTLIFCGRIPEGITKFSLVDEATEGRGYSFRNYTINNPIKSTVLDENFCKDNINKNNDGICGIYEEIGGEKIRVACIKFDDKYYLIYLGCSDRLTWWFTGDVKAYLEESATAGAFKAKWITKYKFKDDAYLTFDGKLMKAFVSNAESSFMKMYPNASTGNTTPSGASEEPSEWSGTGFSLMNNFVVTNYHVVEDAKNIMIQGVNGNFNNKYKATVVASDKNNDLALLKLEDVTVSSINIPYSIKTTTSDVGEDVFVLGYPLTSTMGDEVKLTTGVISSKTGFQGDVSLYQISAPIQPGNSGGPLFDAHGNIIGIVCAHHKDAENVGYAIKSSYLRNLMETAISSDVLPKNNTISGLGLSSKVKAVKNYVYYITCSNKVNVSSSSPKDSNNYVGQISTKTFNFPDVNNTENPRLKVLSVTLSNNSTEIKLQSNKWNGTGHYTWCYIDRNAYILANNKKYTITKTEGITFMPEKTYFSNSENVKTFTLYFPPIPQETRSIDFIESTDSSWKLYGIQLK